MEDTNLKSKDVLIQMWIPEHINRSIEKYQRRYKLLHGKKPTKDVAARAILKYGADRFQRDCDKLLGEIVEKV